jgi:hypothetical protein
MQCTDDLALYNQRHASCYSLKDYAVCSPFEPMLSLLQHGGLKIAPKKFLALEPYQSSYNLSGES